MFYALSHATLANRYSFSSAEYPAIDSLDRLIELFQSIRISLRDRDKLMFVVVVREISSSNSSRRMHKLDPNITVYNLKRDYLSDYTAVKSDIKQYDVIEFERFIQAVCKERLIAFPIQL